MENTPITPLKTPPPKTGAWSVSIYLAADNNLKDECLYALTEILKLGPMPEADAVVQFDSGNAITRYDFRKLRIEKPPLTTGPSEVNGQAAEHEHDLDDLAELVVTGQQALMSVSDKALLTGFLEDTIDESYFNLIVLSGHGSGAIGEFLPTDNPPRSLDIPTLSLMLDSIRKRIRRKINILGMDSCLMSMVEVCYELYEQVDILIGSEGFEQNTGWPYHKVLEILRKEPKINPEELARRIVNSYIDFYTPYYVSGVSVDHTAINLGDGEGINNLTSAINNLAVMLKDNLNRPQVESAVALAHLKAQSYLFEQYVDLWDFCDLLSADLRSGVYNHEQLKNISQSIDGWENIIKASEQLEALIQSLKEWDEIRKSIEDACTNVMKAIDRIRLTTGYNGAAFQHSHGLSIYFPWAKPELDKHLKFYKKLAFSRATQWDEFLEAYTLKTQRAPRNKEDHEKRGDKLLEMMPKGGNDGLFESVNGIKFNPANETRFNPANETRFNPANETRGKMTFTPLIKNLPISFYKDDLQKERKKPIGIEESTPQSSY